MKKIVQAKVEIQKNSRIKYEFNRKTNQIEVDRILRGDFVYPCNYGFIPEALDWDGDELDVLIYSPETFIPGVAVNVRIIGAMKMIDDGETDTKLIGVHADDYRLDNINSLNELPEPFLDSVKTFFSTYKNWKRPGITIVDGFEDVEWAIKEYNECVELMEKYGSLPKKEFIEKMQKEHPEKYL
ncbi:inorganic diphosphatase [Mycoplasma buteonis]|uniref:inorganic diphosphatase n=1 Tax=Mycoplasma buteonis TaxID=171280 RepID=UPI000569E7E2|nr:inorganic diphosphatase [Mycoplasma buteonis]